MICTAFSALPNSPVNSKKKQRESSDFSSSAGSSFQPNQPSSGGGRQARSAGGPLSSTAPGRGRNGPFSSVIVKAREQALRVSSAFSLSNNQAGTSRTRNMGLAMTAESRPFAPAPSSSSANCHSQAQGQQGNQGQANSTQSPLYPVCPSTAASSQSSSSLSFLSQSQSRGGRTRRGWNHSFKQPGGGEGGSRVGGQSSSLQRGTSSNGFPVSVSPDDSSISTACSTRTTNTPETANAVVGAGVTHRPHSSLSSSTVASLVPNGNGYSESLAQQQQQARAGGKGSAQSAQQVESEETPHNSVRASTRCHPHGPLFESLPPHGGHPLHQPPHTHRAAHVLPPKGVSVSPERQGSWPLATPPSASATSRPLRRTVTAPGSTFSCQQKADYPVERPFQSEPHDNELLGHLRRDELIEAIANLLSAITKADRAPGQVTKFDAVRVPQITVRDYFLRLAQYFQCSPTCHLLALVYVDRVVQSSQQGFRVDALNIHRLLVTATMVAAKFYDDKFLSNEFYAQVGGVSTREVNRLESRLLSLLDYRLVVLPPELKIYHDHVMAHLKGHQGGSGNSGSLNQSSSSSASSLGGHPTGPLTQTAQQQQKQQQFASTGSQHPTQFSSPAKHRGSSSNVPSHGHQQQQHNNPLQQASGAAASSFMSVPSFGSSSAAASATAVGGRGGSASWTTFGGSGR
uniref:Cyclin-like domain-containing protein n=1 Tax=Chromera velia CCMP2878 TaxID=1169474 RepID=A0A0G4F2T4_9ALVE|eukprot:Cvel_14704.t1-p1 / transcript=Cvel_14704.t1 / gene=Cvel_14704 / organism=Chromera_velia_CCMP2878 / gene_product=Cyclin-U4-2, putative / transcript_product=Cyclin-U4-2, putative / location=Cvel_scaffold1056:20203-24058(-) / protein_length=686 / sequence_SO=supercontig / SO=protein_coding / is_pseudo=false